MKMANLMGIAKDFVEMVAKEKLLAYFLLLWAGSFFFWAISDIASWGIHIDEMAPVVFALIGVLMELAAGIVLALFAAKFLTGSFLRALSKERLLVYFVLLWAGSFFFWALHDIGDFAYGFGDALALIGALFHLAAGALLGVLGWKLLKTKETSS